MEQSPTTEELLGKIEELQAGHARLREEMTRMRTSDARQMAYSASPSQYRFPEAQRRAAGAGTGQEGTVSLEKSSGSCCHSHPLQHESRGDDSVNGEGTVGGKGDGGGDAGGSCVSGPSVLNFANGRHMNILQSMGQSLHKIITDKAETWIGKTGLTRPWKGNEQKSPELCSNRIPWSQLHNDQETDVVLKNLYAGAKPKSLVGDSDMPGQNEAPGSWSSSCNVSGTTSASSCGSSSTNALNKVEMETDCLDHEILWEDLAIGEQIGQGSCGTVYHGLWYGSNVAIKAFSGQEYTDDVIHSFKQEVSLMKRLRHPNLLLFMGAVTSPERLCIVTEFLPRGSLFQILQKNAPRLDWRRRVHIALDVARGLNYLHHFNPPIVHGDLKSSNLLVDKNWTVKVGDFGLSRLKRETYLSVKDGKGTPQWMAPEILRNEPSDEKSDVYSFGVVLWEICTEKIPWDNLNSMQVIGAVGFMNQRLEIPDVMDPEWTSIIESCWHSEPRRRPAFEKLLEKLKDLQRRYATQLQAARPTSVATAQN